MPHTFVVLDTNIYRALSDKRLANIRTLERRCEVLASPSLLVVGELLVHMRDSGDADYQSSAAALRRVWEHCRVVDGANDVMQFPGPPELIVAESLWGERASSMSANQEGLARFFGEVVRDLVSPGSAADPATIASRLEPIAAFMKNSEEAFAQAVQNVTDQLLAVLLVDGLSTLDPVKRAELDALRSDGRGRVHAAGAYVRRVADAFGQPLTEEQLSHHAGAIARASAVAFELFDAFVAKAIYSGMKVERRANSVWDFYFAFFASTGTAMRGIPVRAISDDGEIHAAAAAVGRADSVWRLSEYEARLSAGTI